MSGVLGRWTDIIGAALFLGLILRYGESAAKLIAVSSHSFVDIFGIVSLQTPKGTTVQGQTPTATLYR